MRRGCTYLAALAAMWWTGCDLPPRAPDRPAEADAGDPTGGEPPEPSEPFPHIAADEPFWPPDWPVPEAFDLPPWLTMPAPGQITVSWRTAKDTTGGVMFADAAAPGYDQVLLSSTPGMLHHVTLDGLPPGTSFKYSVFLDGSDATREGVFTTPGRDRWRFIHLAEFHAPTDAAVVADFTSIIRHFRPHVVVESGDMVNSGDSFDQWRSYFATSGSWISNVILLPAHSNHVNGFQGNAHLLDLFVLPGNERWYATRYGNVQLMTLDSTFDRSDNPDVHAAPDWIRAQVAAASDGIDDPDFLIAAWHYPACSSHYAGRASTRQWIRENFLPAFGDRLDLLLVGHDKYYERSLVNGTIPHVMANAGRLAPSRESDHEPACQALVTNLQTRSIVLAEVSADEPQVRAVVVNRLGEQLDAFTIRR